MNTQGNLPEQSGEHKLCELREPLEQPILSQAFKAKPCRHCALKFVPKALSNLYCTPECAEAGYDNAYYKRTYRITKRDFDSMWVKQGGKCALCYGDGFLMRAHHRKKLVVDHCHKTGKVRALLCHNCNRALGLFHDNPAVLNRAAMYVEFGGRCNDYPAREYSQAAGSAQPPGMG